MKKLVMVFALGAMLGSCGSDAADIDVASLDSPCGCVEASITVMDEMIALVAEAKDLGQDASEGDQKDIEEKGEVLQDKMKEIETKCKGDLAAEKAGDDCAALKELPNKAKEYRKALSGM